MTYAEAIARYGTDKPDLRFGLEIEDATEVTRGSEFGVFAERRGGAVPASCRGRSRAPSSARSRRSRRSGARRGSRTSSTTRTARCARRSRSSSPRRELEAFRSAARARPSSSAPTTPATVARVLGALRLHLGRELGLIDDDGVHVPLGDRLPDVRVGRGRRAAGRAVHHPFTRADRRSGEERFDGDPGNALALRTTT